MDISEFRKKGRFAVVIPLFNHGDTLVEVVNKALHLKIPIFLINDGSTDLTPEKMKAVKGVKVLHHNTNMGKGAALLSGLVEASKLADWAITIDADGQHNPEDAVALIRAIPDGGRPIVVGRREGMAGNAVPWTSRFGRKFSNFWVFVSGGPKVTDSQSGFRIYPLPESLSLNVITKHYQFEVEILVKAGWKDMEIIETPISVNYMPGIGRVSHFRPFVDFIRNARTFARLITQRLFIPASIRKSRC